MDVDRGLRIVPLEQARTFGEVSVEARLLLTEISLIKGHAPIGDDDGPDNLRQALVAFRKGLEVWAYTAEPTEFYSILPIRHLLKLGVDALLAEHGRQEGGFSFEELSEV